MTTRGPEASEWQAMVDTRISVFLADDQLIAREGVKALINVYPDLELVGTGEDYDSLISGVAESKPQVLVTDIRMPPTMTREGIEAAKEVRKRHPGTGVVILSQFDDPEYAIALLSEGSDGYAYLLKDRVGEQDQLARAIREVATGGSMLDPKIVEALMNPVAEVDLTTQEEDLLRLVAEGKHIKAIAAVRKTTPASVASDLEKLFLKLAEQASSGVAGGVNRLKMLHQAIIDREEAGEALSRFVPMDLMEKLRKDGRKIGETENIEISCLMSDVRGYSTIAEKTDPSVLAGQLNQHRAEMNKIIREAGVTLWEFVGDAVMAIFGCPFPQDQHADIALDTARKMQKAQLQLNETWEAEGLSPFGLGVGITMGNVAAGLLGSEERLEYSVVGDTVNLAQRIQQWADVGEIVLLEHAYKALSNPPQAEQMEPAKVKGRENPVVAYRIPAEVTLA